MLPILSPLENLLTINITVLVPHKYYCFSSFSLRKRKGKVLQSIFCFLFFFVRKFQGIELIYLFELSANISSAQNDWKGAWWHSSLNVHSGSYQSWRYSYQS